MALSKAAAACSHRKRQQWSAAAPPSIIELQTFIYRGFGLRDRFLRRKCAVIIGGATYQNEFGQKPEPVRIGRVKLRALDHLLHDGCATLQFVRECSSEGAPGTINAFGGIVCGVVRVPGAVGVSLWEIDDEKVFFPFVAVIDRKAFAEVRHRRKRSKSSAPTGGSNSTPISIPQHTGLRRRKPSFLPSWTISNKY